MSEENKDAQLKFRELTKLKATAAEEYQDAMLHRVEHFSQERGSVFNSTFENALMAGVGLILDAKEKVDALIGDELKDKIQNVFQKLLLAF